MVHTHADAHACPMTGTAGMPLHGHPTANHSGPAGPGRGQGPGKGGCGHDDSPVAEMSALHIAAPPTPDSRMTAKSTASFQWAPRKRRPAPPPPTAAASSSAAATPVASPAASPAPSPRPSPRPSPTPSRPAPPPPVPASLRRPADGASGPGEGAFHAANVADRNCRAPSPVPPVRPVSPVPHGPALAPSYPSSGQTSGSQLQVPQAHYLASGPAPRPPLGPQPAGPHPVVHRPAGPQPAVPQPAGPQPAGPRHTASMDIQPVAPYGVGVVPPRSYTSVNLTLRPPSEQPQAPIDIISEGSSLTYSTSSYDPRQGYQSQLQICIGPNGLGSVSAMRTRAPVPPLGAVPPVPPSAALRRAPPRPPAPSPAPSLAPALEPLAEEPARTAASREELERMVVAMGAADLSPEMREHLVRQLERRMLLETELHKERTKLQLMQKEVAEMERDLQRRSAQARPRAPPALPVMEKVQRLRNEIQTLQEECTRMANEVDAKTPQNNTEEGNNEPGWTCQTCTFHNYYLLEACETCDVPRMRLGSDNNLSGPSGPAGLHALGLSGFPPSSILPSLASPALDAALAPLALAPTPTAMCVPNMLFPSPGHEE